MILIEETGGLTIKLDSLTDSDLFDLDQAAQSHPDFEKMRYIIIDGSSVGKVEITSNGAREAAQRDAEAYARNPDLIVAFIASDVVVTGLANVYRAYFDYYNQAGQWPMRVFEIESQARAWISESTTVD